MMLRVLPNRYIALLLTPREASMLEGQILDPQDFPWQDEEAQVISMGVKAMLHEAVASMVARELDASIDAIHRIEEMRKEALGLKQEDTPGAEEGVKANDNHTQEE